jgi:hypothetical protein
MSIERSIRLGLVHCFGGGSSSGSSGSTEVKPTKDMIAQQQINAKLWNYYQTNYKPLIEQYTKRVTDPTTQAEEKRKVAGQIDAEAMKNIDPSKMSANPVQNTRALARLAGAETGMQVQGQGGVRSRQIGEEQNLINIGRGQATTAEAGLGELASQSVTSEISNLELQQQRQAAVENAYGSVAGAVAEGMLLSSSPTTKVRTLAPQDVFAGGAIRD